MFNIKHNNKQLWYYKKNDMFNIKHNNKELWYYKKNDMFNNNTTTNNYGTTKRIKCLTVSIKSSDL